MTLVAACGHPAPPTATTTPPAAALSPSPSATPLITDSLADRAACAGWNAGFDSDFAAFTREKLDALVNTTLHGVDPVLVRDVNMWLKDSQRQGIASDSPAAAKIFADCHSIGA